MNRRAFSSTHAIVERRRSAQCRAEVAGRGADQGTRFWPWLPPLPPLIQTYTSGSAVSRTATRLAGCTPSARWAVWARARAAVPALTEALKDPLPAVRRLAVIALVEMGVEARPALPCLTQALYDGHQGVRCRAILALGEIGPDARVAAPALVQLLQDPIPLVRRWAAWALGEIGPTAPASIPALIEALAEDDVCHCAVTAAALTKMGQRATPRLIEALRHADPRVRRYAAKVLGKCGRRVDAAEALADLQRDSDPLIRAAGAEALRKLP